MESKSSVSIQVGNTFFIEINYNLVSSISDDSISMFFSLVGLSGKLRIFFGLNLQFNFLQKFTQAFLKIHPKIEAGKQNKPRMRHNINLILPSNSLSFEAIVIVIFLAV